MPSWRSLCSDSALLALNSARERVYSQAALASISCRSPESRLSQTRLLMPREKPEPGLMKAGIVVVAHRLVQTDRHVEPGTNPFAGVNGARLKRWHDLPTGQRHHASAQPPQHLCARAGHPVAQAPESQRRSDLVREPPAHLAAAARAKQWLDIELAAERVPQLLPA